MKKILFLLLFINNTYAFTLNNNISAAFNQDEVKINMAANTDCSATGLTDDEILSLAIDGAETFWNRVATSSLKLVRGELKTVSGDFETGLVCDSGSANNTCTPNDALKVTSDILIACNTNTSNFSSNAYVMAVALPNNIVNGVIKGALILINSSGTTNNNTFGNINRSQQISVLTHEIGHAVGLGHSGVKDSMMYFESIEKRSALGWDDIMGITYLYPQQQPLSCASITTFKDDNISPRFSTGLLTLLIGLFIGLSLGLFISPSPLLKKLFIRG